MIALVLAAIAVAGVGCIEDFIPDRPDYSGFDDISIPDGFEFDLKDIVDDAETCDRNCYGRVCGPDDCGGTCGACPQGTLCALDYSICLPEDLLLPDGSLCGQNSACEPVLENPFSPGTYYDNPDWPACMGHQCKGLVCERNVCTRPCVVRKDDLINGTAMAGSDGIEDDGTMSDCETASGGAWNGGMLCVGRGGDQSGQLVGVCEPAASYMPCNPTDACPGNESCGYLRIGMKIERRCMAGMPGGAADGARCGYDRAQSTTILCSSWQCHEGGCTRPCDSDEDCLSDGAACESGLCAGTGRPCNADVDCSVMFCSDMVYIDDLRVRACVPRRCSGDTDCPGTAHYCQPSVEFDPTGSAVASGKCLPVNSGGAPVGTPCARETGGGVVVCRNGDLCIDGMCTARCGNDLDCFIHGPYRCAQAAQRFETGMFDVETWLDVGYCRATGYGPEGCGTDPECGAGRVCVPWVRVDDEGPAVVTTCVPSREDAWPIGTECGEFAWGAVCETGYCFGEDAVKGIPGWCSQLCSTDADCPDDARIGTVDFRWTCRAMAVSGGTSATVEDDLFASWCVPVPLASSLADCSKDRWCADPGEVCTPLPRLGPSIANERVDYVCTAVAGGAPDGSICDPFGDGRDCASRICEPSQATSIGFCSHVCGSDAHCAMFGDAVTCNQRQFGRDRTGQMLGADICRMTGDCVVCADDQDCDIDHLCANISGNYWSQVNRCVRICQSDLDCADSPGTTCKEVSNLFSVSDRSNMACMNPACSI